MSQQYVLGIVTHTFYLILIIASPMLLSTLTVGVIISVLQATTQIQEQTLSFVPRLLVAFVSMIIAGPWLASALSKFAVQLFTDIARINSPGGL